MRPSYTIDDMTDCSLTSAVLFGKGLLTNPASGIGGPDSTNSSNGQLGATLALAARAAFRVCVGAVAFAARRHMSAFLVSVGVVIGQSSKKQMPRSGIAAGRIITMVKNTESGRNRSVRNGPRDAMSVDGSSRVVGFRTTAEPAVTLRDAESLPRPAFIRTANIDLLPKPKNVLLTQRRDATMFGSHDSLLSRDSWSERFAANPQAVRFTEQYIGAAA